MNGRKPFVDRPGEALAGRERQPRHADGVDHDLADDHRGDGAGDAPIPAELRKPADESAG